jgi:hypothetical protein
MSRSVLKNSRIFVDGYDMSGYSRSFGPLTWSFEQTDLSCLQDTLRDSSWMGQATISPGTLNALFDNTALAGTLARLSAPAASRTVLIAMGMEAAPADNGLAWGGQFQQTSFQSADDMTVSIGLGQAVDADNLLYSSPWGVLLHANAIASAVNASDTGHDHGAETTKGGFMVWQATTAVGTGNIEGAIKIQDSTSESSAAYADLLSTGTLNFGSSGVAVPQAGIVALGTGAHAQRYTRWQIVKGTGMTSLTFAAAFFRNFNN